MSEVVEVAKESGVEVRDGLVDQLIERILGLPGVVTSMQTDVKNHRPLELDVILGVPVRKARELGVRTPVLECIYALVKGVDYGLREGKLV